MILTRNHRLNGCCRESRQHQFITLTDREPLKGVRLSDSTWDQQKKTGRAPRFPFLHSTKNQLSISAQMFWAHASA